MSGVTKGQLATQNAELLNAVKQLEKMNQEAMALARRARNDTDDTQLAAAWFKRQRDTMIGFIEGGQKDRESGPSFDSLTGHTIQRPRTATDEFLDMMRQDPEIVNATAERRIR